MGKVIQFRLQKILLQSAAPDKNADPAIALAATDMQDFLYRIRELTVIETEKFLEKHVLSCYVEPDAESLAIESENPDPNEVVEELSTEVLIKLLSHVFLGVAASQMLEEASDVAEDDDVLLSHAHELYKL